MVSAYEYGSESFAVEEVTCVHETDKALLVKIDGQELWVPQSQIKDESEVFDGRDNSFGLLVVSTWFAKQKGWI